MNVKRILIIESINDQISRRRADMIAKSPLFGELTLEHCYPVNIEETDLQQANHPNVPPDFVELAIWESQGSPLSYENLLQTLERKVQDFQPDVILLHTGVVFHRHPQTVLQVLTVIKDKYPQIRIGYQHNPSCTYLDNEVVFDRDEITKAIERMVFEGKK